MSSPHLSPMDPDESLPQTQHATGSDPQSTDNTFSTHPTDINPPPSPEPRVTRAILSSSHPSGNPPKREHTPAQKKPMDIKPVPRTQTEIAWGPPAGLPIRGPTDENLRIFRIAMGINAHMRDINLPSPHTTASVASASGWWPFSRRRYRALQAANTNPYYHSQNHSHNDLEPGKTTPTTGADVMQFPYNCNPSLDLTRATATGIYLSALTIAARRQRQHTTLKIVLYTLYFLQIIIGASLTAMGPSMKTSADTLPTAITCLGALNTVIAGLLALVKGQGLGGKLRREEAGYRRLRDWIEGTEVLVATGVVGRDKVEIGGLVEGRMRRFREAGRGRNEKGGGEGGGKTEW